MRRCSILSLFLLSFGVLVSLTGKSHAQFIPNFTPGIYATNSRGQSVGFNFSYGYNLSVVSRNPYTGSVQSAFIGASYSGPFLPPWLARPVYAPYAYGYANNYYGGAVAGSGSMDAANNPIVQEQLRILKAAGRNNVNDVEARKAIADQLAKEQQARVAANPNAAAAFVKATEEDIASGTTLTDLASEIIRLEKRGLKADSPLLTPELLSRIRFVSGTGADLREVMQEGKPALPEFMNERGWLVVRTELQQVIDPIFDAILAGKKVDATDLAKLTRQLKKTRNDVVTLSKEIEFSDATRINKLLNNLERLTKLSTDPKWQGVFVPTWRMSGATVSEFVNHNEKYAIYLDAADQGDFDSYFALYRAMLTYYMNLLDKADKR